MNVDQLITQLRAAMQKLIDARAQGEAARRLTDEARQLVSGALGGESRLTAAVAALEADLKHAAGTVPSAVGKIAEAAGRARTLAAGGAAGPHPPLPQLPATGGQEPVGPDVAPPSYVRDAAQRLSVPVGAKVAGVMLQRDGSPVGDSLDRPLVNGRRGGLPGVEGRASLSSGYVAGTGTPRWNRLDVATSHVEGHAAAALRTPDAPAEVVLVTSQDPCPGTYGCDATLAGQLPEGTRLYVYVSKAGGSHILWQLHRNRTGGPAMTYTVWWALDQQDVTDPADVEEAIEEAWSRVYPHGGRGICIRLGPTAGGEQAAPLRIDIDILEGRAAVRWTPDGSHAVDPGLPPHPRPLTIAGSPYDPPDSVSGELARVTPGAALGVAAEYVTTGERTAELDWRR